VNTQLDPGKQPDICPPTAGNPTLAMMAPDSPEAAALIKTLVDHHVALTSTLQSSNHWTYNTFTSSSACSIRCQHLRAKPISTQDIRN
jgi:hypothetical protein